MKFGDHVDHDGDDIDIDGRHLAPLLVVLDHNVDHIHLVGLLVLLSAAPPPPPLALAQVGGMPSTCQLWCWRAAKQSWIIIILSKFVVNNNITNVSDPDLIQTDILQN